MERETRDNREISFLTGRRETRVYVVAESPQRAGSTFLDGDSESREKESTTAARHLLRRSPLNQPFVIILFSRAWERYNGARKLFQVIQRGSSRRARDKMYSTRERQKVEIILRVGGSEIRRRKITSAVSSF